MREKSLKTEFFTAVTVTLLLVAAASALTFWGCLRLQRWLVPDTRYVMLDLELQTSDGEITHWRVRCELDGEAQPYNDLRELKNGVPVAEDRDIRDMVFSVESVDYGIGRNGPRREAAYIAAGAAMGVLPAVYAVAGALLCAVWFYRRKLAPAITVLDGAARHIREQDLDFTVECPLNNELGRLCGSFERMRQALYDNNLQLWRALEERRTMSACVAHDLRNPLAIMEGLLEHLRDVSQAGELTQEKLELSLTDLEAAAERMERYTDCIRDLDAIEDTQARPSPVTVPDFLREAAGSVGVLAEARGLAVDTALDVPEGTLELDREIFYRVLENVFSNAARYARSRVTLTFALRRDILTVTVADDGPGFSEKMLRKKNSLYYSEDLTGRHRGLGLATGRILCQKHGGTLSLANRPQGGGTVEFTLAVKQI